MNEKALQRLEYDKIKGTLLEYAITYVGKKHVEQMQPLTAEKTIRKKLDETAEAKTLLQQGASVPIPSLEGIENILTLLGTGYVFTEKDFSHILQFLTSCGQLMKYMATKAEVAPGISTYAASMSPMKTLKADIEQCIRHGQVIDTASKELSKVRKRIAVFEERLKSKLDTLMSKHRAILQENVVSMRNGRYVIPVKKEYRKQVVGSVLDESASGQTVYMEPAEIGSLQAELSALRAEEEREVLKVLMQLSALMEEYAHELQLNVETVGTYDFLFAKAKYALALDASNVELNEQGFIDLRDARHPLLGKQMVPVNFQTGYRYRSLIITGPNTGGKTLTLKTIGLLTMMVQSGLLVPVQEGSKFSIFRTIAVDIGDGQSIEHALSTFSAHIHNVIDILQVTDSSTLVLIDEMASGTDPGEGVALSIAILEELHRRKATIIATTHFNEIKNFAAVTPGFENARMEFDADTLQPLYRLRIGEAGQSYAFAIALKIGLPMEIIERSYQISAQTHTDDFVQTDKPKESTAAGELTETQSLPETEQTKPMEVKQSHTPKATDRQAKTFAVGDSVYVSYLGRTGIVYAAEDARGNVGVMIQKQKFQINKKRLALHIEGKELYPDDYDLDIVLETKENRKKRKLMGKKHVEGLSIETGPQD